MKLNRFLSCCMAILLVFTATAGAGIAAPQKVRAAELEDAQSGEWFEMDDGIAVRLEKRGESADLIKVGDTFSVQFWIRGIAPQSLTIPLSWNADVVTVVDKATGEIVTDGRKTEGDLSSNAGFRPGVRCYDTSMDDNYMPIYWNGKPVYTVNTAENSRGYPYLNNQTGLYQFFYFVLSPTRASIPQMILEVDFKAIKVGNPEFRFATAANGMGDIEKYDPASPEGMLLSFPLSLDGDEDVDRNNVEVYTDRVEFPEVKVVNEIVEATALPSLPPVGKTTPAPSKKPSSTSSSAAQRPNTGVNAPTAPQSTPTPTPTPVQLKDAVHFSAWMYSEPVECAAMIYQKMSAPLSVEDGYILPPGIVSEAINKTTEKKEAKAILARTPEQIFDTEDYKILIYASNLDDMLLSGIHMLYIETPFGVVGLNIVNVLNYAHDNSAITLTASKITDGIKLRMSIDGKEIGNFDAPIFRVIMDVSDRSNKELLVPMTNSAFGTEDTAELPLSIHHYYPDKNALVFLSTVAGEIHIRERSARDFVDTAKTPWAEEEISRLAQKGIISGVSETEFKPEDRITRAQFAVMVTKTFSAYVGQPETGFNDVAKDNYFYPYIACAKEVGICNGVSDSEFMPDAEISRQDLAVMLYRGSEMLGISLKKSGKQTTFKDDAEIADYAKTAVYALSGAEIINGMGDNKFEPKAPATRAQAARIMALLYEYIEDLV